jgi:SAM-dependent methyltransferase
MSLPYRDARFDLVASFDVMSQYGVTDDDAALREFARVLAPGGRLLLRLPAFKWMRGQHDTAADVEKRYAVPQVKAKLHAAGLMCERASYANTFLFPLAAAKRLAERFSPPQSRSDLTIDTGPFNAVLRAVLAAEAPLVAGCGLPYGLTIVALARKTIA